MAPTVLHPWRILCLGLVAEPIHYGFVFLSVVVPILNGRFQADMRSFIRAYTETVIPSAKSSSPLRTVNFSLLEMRPVLAMRVWICCRLSGRASHPNLINSWAAGALGSAWRAVDQYLALNQPESVRLKFWDLWGPTEYWDEASDKGLVNLNRELTERHLVIALHKSGVRFSPQKQTTFPWALLEHLNFFTRNV